MCWSASISLKTYIFSLFACLFAYFNDKITLSMFAFYQSYMLMQLVEYFIWSKQFSNRLLSQIAYILVLLQPIFGILSVEKHEMLKMGLIFAYFLCYVFIFKPWSTIDFRSTPAANGHLAWNWLQFSVPVLIIWFMFLLSRSIINKDLLGVLSLLIPVSYSYYMYRDTLTWGSLWCWFSNIMAIYLIYVVFADDLCV